MASRRSRKPLALDFIAADLRCLAVPIEDLKSDSANARLHSDRNISVIAASLKRYGQRTPVVLNVSNGEIEKGNGTLAAARSLGWKMIAVVKVEDDPATHRGYSIADNRAGELAGWSLDRLDEQLAELGELDDVDLGELGFGDDDLAALQEAQTPPAKNPPQPITQDDPPPPPAKKNAITKPGDLWLLGDHRLLCGDSTQADDVARLMDGAKINVAFTSPPYASQRKYDESSGFKPIPPDDYVDWWEPIQAAVAEHLAADGSFFVNIKPHADGLDTHLYVFDLVLAHVRRWGWHFATEYCWERNGVPKSVTRRFKNQFEPVYQFTRGQWKMRPDAVRHASADVPMSLGPGSGNTGWKDNQGTGGVIPSNRRPRGAGKTSTKSLDQMQRTGCDVGDVVVSGLAYPGNRLPTFVSTHEALGHTAAFPVGLPAFFLQAYSDNGDTAYEPFSGSGSTLIAAEQLHRRCYAMEISPAYCDVAVTRWEKLTGRKAKRQAAAKPRKPRATAAQSKRKKSAA